MNNLLNKIYILFILVVIGIMPNVGYADTTELSGANTASVRGIESVYLNVAGLTGTNKTEIMFSNASWFGDISINSFGVAQKVGDTGVMGISFMSLDFGDIIPNILSGFDTPP